MLPQMGPPETTIWEYPGEDQSWRTEFEHFRTCIEQGRQPLGTLADAVAALEVVERVYRQANIHLSHSHPQPELRKAI
jgi:predicted dehydrogenase